MMGILQKYHLKKYMQDHHTVITFNFATMKQSLFFIMGK